MLLNPFSRVLQPSALLVRFSSLTAGLIRCTVMVVMNMVILICASMNYNFCRSSQLFSREMVQNLRFVFVIVSLSNRVQSGGNIYNSSCNELSRNSFMEYRKKYKQTVIHCVCFKVHRFGDSCNRGAFKKQLKSKQKLIYQTV